jgi:RND family efflux transporter MFP subunit
VEDPAGSEYLACGLGGVMCNPSRLSLVLAIALAFIPAGCRKPAPPEEELLAPVKVVSAKLTDDLDESTELIGATQPLPGQLSRITAPVEGHVENILTDEEGKPLVEGQRVKKHSVVVQLDDRVARANNEKLSSMLAEGNEVRKQADLAHELALLELKRLENLNTPGSSGTIPLVAKIEIEKAQLADAKSKQKASFFKEKTLKAELAAAAVQLDFYKLRAPIDGYLGAIQVVPGQTLMPGTAVAEVINLDQIDLVCFAPPNSFKKLRLDQDAVLGGIQGKVAFLGIQAQPDTGNFMVKIRFPNKDLRLRANELRSVHVQTQAKKKRWTIPEAVVMEDQDPPVVVTVVNIEKKQDKEKHEFLAGKARKLRVILGVRDREKQVVEILKLEDADHKEVPIADVRFISEGGHGLHENDLLKIAEEH